MHACRFLPRWSEVEACTRRASFGVLEVCFLAALSSCVFGCGTEFRSARVCSRVWAASARPAPRHPYLLNGSVRVCATSCCTYTLYASPRDRFTYSICSVCICVYLIVQGSACILEAFTCFIFIHVHLVQFLVVCINFVYFVF